MDEMTTKKKKKKLLMLTMMMMTVVAFDDRPHTREGGDDVDSNVHKATMMYDVEMRRDDEQMSHSCVVVLGVTGQQPSRAAEQRTRVASEETDTMRANERRNAIGLHAIEYTYM
jgi:hypothetical protein